MRWRMKRSVSARWPSRDVLNFLVQVLGRVKSFAKQQFTAPEPEEVEDAGAASLLD